jgi:hypothetical protein
LHDYLCSQANIYLERTQDVYGWYSKRIEANKYFEKALKKLNINKITLFYLTKGVNIGLKWRALWQ